MSDVTDMAFRQIVCDCGKPDVLYTEFVSADGLNYVMKAGPADAKAMAGKAKLLPHLSFKENERPIVAQIFGSVPEHFYECAKLIAELGFDGIDINMGCPERKILKQNSGAALINNPELAQQIIIETKRGAGNLPVSIKTRIGYNTIVTEEWVSKIIEAKPDAIIVHGRTMKEASKAPAHWDEIGKAARLCHAAGIIVVGNGDVMSYTEGIEKAKQYDLDGIMVGRGIFQNPWFFHPHTQLIESSDGKASNQLSVGVNPSEVHTREERINLLKKHIQNFVELWGAGKNFDVMKRFIKIYINDFEGAKEIRNKLMKIKTAPETLEKLESLASRVSTKPA